MKNNHHDDRLDMGIQCRSGCKLFVVGGAGYIGSHMVKQAHNVGYEVIAIDNLVTGYRDAVLYGKFEYCDILDARRLTQLFTQYKPDAVIHFGGYSIVSESVRDPYKYYYNNVAGSLNLFKVMVDTGCKKLIFSSTAAIFGDPEYLPIDEAHIKKPINPYGKSKLMVEEMLKDFDSAYGLKYISFRYFNAAGHDPEGELSERHDPETHLLPIVIRAANGERGPVNVFGVDYDTFDGTCIRDYIHVNDLVNAHLKGLVYLNNKSNMSTEINLGNNNGFSVKEVIQKIKDIMNKDFEVIDEERRDGDPPALIASNKKAKKELSLSPDYVSLESIIKTLA
jgi:UDP-glucose 4-epimerase